VKKYKAGIIGATGMVGQRFVSLLKEHPWFETEVLAASANSAGKTYAEAVGSRWVMQEPLPEKIAAMTVLDAQADIERIAKRVDFVFCAVNLPKADTKKLEEDYARHECPVISNNSANRLVPDVPMVIPEINDGHTAVIKAQRKRLGASRGFIAVKSNCSIQCYVPALHPLLKYGLKKVAACTYQAISGAGKTFGRWPEMLDNVIPFIGGEEEKSEVEPMKIWGDVQNGEIVPAAEPAISAQCVRVPVSDGHLAAVFAEFENPPSLEEIISDWRNYKGAAQLLELPSAPKQFLRYFDEPDRPQTKLDRDLENGMGVSIGRLRRDGIFSVKFISLAHNTLRGAAGGGVLLAELLAKQGYLD
jgi:aspartate-semialdehyde dehydrogenase